jgi:hypothetical protein
MKWVALMYRKPKKLSINFEAGIMIAIGYQDVHQVLPESLRQRAYLPRERKPLSEFAFLEELGNGIIP